MTVARIAAAPMIAFIFLAIDRPLADWIALSLFVAASITDFLDGWLARRLSQLSEVGKMLDPIADKAVILISLMVLVALNDLSAAITVPAALIVLREVLISGVREYLGAIKLPVTLIAKLKTAAQMTAIGGLFLVGTGELPVVVEGAAIALLWMAMLLTLVSGWDYVLKALAHIGAAEDL